MELRRRHLLAAVLGLPELVSPVLRVLLLQGLHSGDDQLQGLVRLLGVVDDEAGVLLKLGSIIHRLTPACL